MVLDYDDRPEAGSLDLGGGRSLPVWRFRCVSLRAVQPDGKEQILLEVRHAGWVARDLRQLAALDPNRYPDIADRIESARTLVRQTDELRRSYAGTSGRDGAGGASGQPDPNGSGASCPLKDIIDLAHYVDGIEAVLDDLRNFPSHKEKMKWLAEHLRRLRRAYEYAASVLASIADDMLGPEGPRSGGDGAGGRGPGRPGDSSDASDGNGDGPQGPGQPGDSSDGVGGWFEPGGLMGLPADALTQALGFRG